MTTDIQRFEDSGIRLYQSASMLVITDDEAKLLDEKIKDLDIEIRPDGLIYPPQVYWRDKLNQTFGRGQWALLQHSVVKDPDRDKIYYDGSLMIRGHFIARAIGEQEYYISNPMQSWGSAAESAKSDCLGRCCKDLGIFKELWEPNFVREWLKKNAVKVFIKGKDDKTKVSWRRIDSEPYYNETGFVPDSPNKPTNGKKSEQKQAEKPKGRNYTEEANKCKSLEDLQKWFTNDLTKEERKLYANLKDNRKEELIALSLPSVNDKPDILMQTINTLNKKNFDKQIVLVEQLIEDHKGDRKPELIEATKKKIAALGMDYTIIALPF